MSDNGDCQVHSKIAWTLACRLASTPDSLAVLFSRSNFAVLLTHDGKTKCMLGGKRVQGRVIF